MKKLSGVVLLLMNVSMVFGCQSPNANHFLRSPWSSTSDLRNLTADERARDFDELLTLFKDYYGPYAYKENRFKMNIEQLAAQLKVQALNAKSDEEFAGYVMQFGAALKDGHVQISVENSSSGIKRYKIPLLITPVEGKAIIGDISDDLKKFTGFSSGDEVLEIDGKAPFDYLPTILKYKSLAVGASEKHLVIYALSRPSFMADLIPTSKTARIKVKTADGDLLAMDVPWEAEKYNKDLSRLIPNDPRMDLRVPFAEDLNSVVDGHVGQMGQVEPFFLTPQTKALFKFVKVYPSDAARKKFGLADKETPPIYAALYRYGGKQILLVRQATYAPDDYKPPVYLKAYEALLDEYQDLADVLVLDQTHNGGGSYCADFYDLFAQTGDQQGAELLHADRKWVNDLKVKYPQEDSSNIGSFDARTTEAWGLMVEKAYDQGQLLSDPVPLFSGSFFPQPRDMNWSKPMLVLTDELAGSCADMFPMLIKANHRAKIFGQGTMGLGGNVEEVGVLPNSRIHVKLTRGMFYPYKEKSAPSDFIENNGVAPDYPYSHTVADFRRGFLGYVKAFSEKAVNEAGN